MTRSASIRLVIPEAPSEADRIAVLAPLAAFNAENGFPGKAELIALLLQDESGATVGGLWGKTVYDWLFVEYLGSGPITANGHDEAERRSGLGARRER